MWSNLLFSIAIVAYTALAVEPIPDGIANIVEKRDTSEYCGTDNFGTNYYCLDSTCCVGASVWSCVGPDDECCTTGYMCPGGSDCTLDSFGNQFCLTGSTSVTAQAGAAAQTQAAAPTSAGATVAPAPTQKTKNAAMDLGVREQWMILVPVLGAVAAPVLGF